MAESKATVLLASGSSSPLRAMWSTMASGANNIYVDVNNVDCSKLILLVMDNRATAITATCGKFYIGTSDSAASGSTFAYPYSAAKLRRLQIQSTRSADTDAAFPSTGGKAQLTVFGPFETARFKSSQGYIKFAKRKSAGDAGNVYVCPILIK